MPIFRTPTNSPPIQVKEAETKVVLVQDPTIVQFPEITQVGGQVVDITTVGDLPEFTPIPPDWKVSTGPLHPFEPAPTPLDFYEIDPVRVITSRRSTTAYHSTLFEDFDFRAESVYNYYTDDERTNTVQDENIPAHQLPRYVELFWRTVPLRSVLSLGGSKMLRPLDGRQIDNGTVAGIKDALDAAANGFIQPGAVDALIVAPTNLETTRPFSEDQFLTARAGGGLSAANFATIDGSEFHSSPLPTDTVQSRITFIDPSIAGAAAPARVVLSEDQVHLTQIAAISKLLSGLEVLSEFNQDVPPMNPPPAFPAPADAPTLTYVGYLIERHEVRDDGSMLLNRVIEIDDPGQRRFVDREVKFGTRYVYRIRTAVQWTHPPDIGFTGPSTINRCMPFDPAAGTPRKEASFYASDWSDWARAEIVDNVLPDPPDELTVRPVSHRRLIDVVWRMPNDPQRDVRRARLVRCTETDGRLSPWKILGEFPAKNGRFVDRDVGPFSETHTKYVYAMYSLSTHGEMSELSEQVEVSLADPSRKVREFPVRQVAPRGADPMGDSHSSRLPIRDWNIIARERVGFYIRKGSSVHPLHDRTYVVEVQSLSTGERAQVTLSVDSTDINVGTATVARRA